MNLFDAQSVYCLSEPRRALLALVLLAGQVSAQQPTTPPKAVLVELFTSEGCSSCPPADELLRQVNGHTTSEGQLIVGLSEHVSYWDGLGWKDPYSSEFYTDRQSAYSTHFGLDGVYTPQMVVNGREQFVGGDGSSLRAALASEAQRKQIALNITSAQIANGTLTFNYSASDLPSRGSFHVFAVLADDVDRSHVLRGENNGRDLLHVSVARALVPVGKLQISAQRQVSLPLPSSFAKDAGSGHHLILFAQQDGGGAVIGIDAKPL